jgi:hypothetical protein
MAKNMIKKSNIRILLLAILFVYIMFVPAAGAQENLKMSDKPSQLEQGLIDALNSNAKLSTDDVVANYCKANNDKIPALTNETFSAKNKLSLKTYQLNDGSNITFTNKGFFLIDNLEVNNNTIQPIDIKSEMNPQSGDNSLFTPSLNSSVSEYNKFGWKLFTVCTEGYFEYDHKSVQPYHTDSWYVHKMPFNLWQISNWEKGVHIISNDTAEVYGQGNFHYGFEYNGNGLIVQNYYVKVYLLCDQNGNYGAHYSVTEFAPGLKIGSVNIEF